MRANSNFKLSKSSKRLMASTADRVKSNQIKRMMIEAELASAIQPKISREKNRGN